uniref:Uncharacterized protein n=1 Tax=Aegilops tauschii subsp. strangulata TaxID=200361 RepID=A0A453SHL3_AEGTS
KDAARKAVSGHLVVDRLLSPFQANPRVIVDELRATAWKHQGVVTVQEVASDDGRFVLNFAAEGDRRFMLKAQPWHYKRDGLVFAEFDGKGDPTEIDLGVMAIWVQVRGLPFELKTESMGWSFWDQIGEVLEVSHHNHVIVEKFLRVRVEVILHEPLKSTVEFIPLGSSKIVKYDVLYEKLPLYYECCGIVGHTSERFCNIPSDKGVPTFPKNLSVEAYWKGQGVSRRVLNVGGSSHGEKVPITGININKAVKTMDIIKVASAVRELIVSEKEVVVPASSATMAMKEFAGAEPGQEGQAKALG